MKKGKMKNMEKEKGLITLLRCVFPGGGEGAAGFSSHPRVSLLFERQRGEHYEEKQNEEEEKQEDKEENKKKRQQKKKRRRIIIRGR